MEACTGRILTVSLTCLMEAANETLTRLFTTAKMQDSRSQPVFQGARQLYVNVQRELAVRRHSEAFKCVQDYKAAMEKLSGFPITFEETTTTLITVITGPLPTTGSNTTGLVLLALGLVTGGLMLLLLRRRHRPSSTR